MFTDADRIAPDFSMRAIRPRNDALLFALAQQANLPGQESAYQRLDHRPLTA